MIRHLLFFVAAGFLILTSPVFSGIKVTQVEKSFEDGMVRQTTNIIYIEGNRFRVDSRGDQENMTVIFRGDKDEFWMIDNIKKTYTVLTREDLKQIGQKMQTAISDAMKQMQEQLKNLPPEQRAMMESMMKEQMAGAPTESPQSTTVSTHYKKVAGGQKIGPWTCTQYEGYQDGEKVEEVWAANPEDLGFKESDLKIFEEMERFFSELSPGEASGFHFSQGEEEGEYPGFPIKEIVFSQGRMEQVNETQEIVRENFGPQLFELPQNLRRAESPFEMLNKD